MENFRYCIFFKIFFRTLVVCRESTGEPFQAARAEGETCPFSLVLSPILQCLDNRAPEPVLSLCPVTVSNTSVQFTASVVRQYRKFETVMPLCSPGMLGENVLCDESILQRDRNNFLQLYAWWRISANKKREIQLWLWIQGLFQTQRPFRFHSFFWTQSNHSYHLQVKQRQWMSSV